MQRLGGTGGNSCALLFGPYASPAVSPGDWIDCEIAGRVKVGGYTSAPIPWPRVAKPGRSQLVVCGDLVRAIRSESELAVCHWWGVGAVTVWKWRRALGVGRVTEGTSKLLLANGQAGCLQPGIAAKGREAARCDYDARARMIASKEGRPAHPATAEALRKAAKRPKSEAWKASRRGKAMDRKTKMGRPEIPYAGHEGDRSIRRVDLNIWETAKQASAKLRKPFGVWVSEALREKLERETSTR